MEHPTNTPRDSLAWPKFAAAAVVLAVLLAIIWMTAAVQRLRAKRILMDDFERRNAPALQTNAPALDSRLSAGDAASGRRIFFENPEANCVKCHVVQGPNGDLGPSLQGVGSRLNREALLESMLRPNQTTVPGYESVTILLTNSVVITGFLKAEFPAELQVFTTEDGLVHIQKSAIQLRQTGLSPMPKNLDTLLNAQQLRDLVEYLASLK